MLKANKEYQEKSKTVFNEAEVLSKDWKTPSNWSYIFYKTYPRLKQIPLKPSSSDFKSLGVCLRLRTSRRRYMNKHLSYRMLSDILYFSAGIKNAGKIHGKELHDPKKAKRFYPSGGARYPIEIYVIASNVQWLERGLYHYNVLDNTLEQLIENDLRGFVKSSLNGRSIAKAGALIILTGVLSRQEVKYGNMALRLALIESGHITQNMSLLTANYDIGSCAVSGFDSDEISKLIDLDTGEEIPLYAFTVGQPNE